VDPIDPFAVDVVIPVRDGARYLRPCLDSVIAQTRPARAAIVVDDGSTDATPNVLADYQRHWPALEVVRSEKRGLPHARNAGIRRCRAAFVAFLDSDDVWMPDKLERQLRLFAAEREQVGFVYCGYRHIDADGRPLDKRPIAPMLRGDVLSGLLLHGNLISGSGSAVIARRSLLERAGGFDESLSFGEDWDLWLKLAELSQADFVPQPLVAIRIHGESMQHQTPQGHDLGIAFASSAGTRRPARGARRVRASGSPESFLLERLRIVSKWINKVPYGNHVLERCRIDAVRVGLKNVLLRFPPRFGLRRYLRESDVALARQLFPTWGIYARSFVRAVADALCRTFANARAAVGQDARTA